MISGCARRGLMVAAIGGPKRLSKQVLGLGQRFFVPVFFLLLGAKIDLRALGSSHRAILLAGTAIAVHVLASVVIRARAIGLLAGAQVGVPAAVIALGLPSHAINQSQASAIFCAALASIAASSTGAVLLRRTAAVARPAAGRGRLTVT